MASESNNSRGKVVNSKHVILADWDRAVKINTGLQSREKKPSAVLTAA